MTTGTTRSADGTTIGWQESGSGPALVVLHGAMSAGWHHRDLAGLLTDDATVVVPDRRGRGLSPQRGHRVDLSTDVDDLMAVLRATGARRVLGISSGAVVALHTALRPDAGIAALAAFEPPLFDDPAEPTRVLQRFDAAVARGRLARAAVVGMQGAQLGPPFLQRLPVWAVSPMVTLAMRAEARRPVEGQAGMRELVSLLHDDFDIVREASGRWDALREVRVPVRLVGAQRSPAYLGAALTHLTRVLPTSSRVELPGVDHAVGWNTALRGRPAVLADEVRSWLRASAQDQDRGATTMRPPT